MFEVSYRISIHPNKLAVLEDQLRRPAIKVADGIATFAFQTTEERDFLVKVARATIHAHPISN